MAMKQIHGFRIRLKLAKLIKWPNCTEKAMAMVLKSLKKSLKGLLFLKPCSGYTRIGRERLNENTPVPRGYLAVYFGEEEDNIRRVLVPVIYFNHPLFGDLLREAEKVYGHDHCGGIHVPCRLSEFEDVQSRICATGGWSGSFGRSRRSWL